MSELRIPFHFDYNGNISARSGSSVSGIDHSVPIPNSRITDCGSAWFGGEIRCFDDFSGPFRDISTTNHRIHEGKESIGSRRKRNGFIYQLFSEWQNLKKIQQCQVSFTNLKAFKWI